MPGNRPSYGSSGGGPSYGGSPVYDSYWGNAYWGGCYYWGGRYYFSDGYYYSLYGDGFGFDHGHLPMRQTYGTSAGGSKLSIFFPPTPPPLDTPAPVQSVSEPGLMAPDELVSFVADPFYAPLSTRLAQGNLTEPLRQRLEAYRVTKAELQAQLHAKLAALSSVDAAAKENALATFAREQTPRIVALEAAAERLRTDFLRGGLAGLFTGTGDWNEHRSWRLGTGWPGRNPDESLVPEFRVMRAAVFYQDGLTPAQRRLLREVAMELQAQAFAPAGKASPTVDETLVFFSPDTARVRLPADLPPDLAAKLSAYQKEKSALKTQLRDTLFQTDRATNSDRSKALKQLAAKQTPRLAALEEQAEDIRRGLANWPHGPMNPAAIAFPPDLMARVVAYRKELARLQEAVHAKIAEISLILPATQFTVVDNTASANGFASPTLELRPTVHSTAKRQLVEEAIAAFNAEHREQASSMQKKWTGIRGSTAAFVAAHPEAAPGKSLESVLQDLVVASGEKDARPLYEDYATAVYQPGLSPEQRRLLFDAALQKLALPLPGGEWQP